MIVFKGNISIIYGIFSQHVEKYNNLPKTSEKFNNRMEKKFFYQKVVNLTLKIFRKIPDSF